MCWRVLQAGHIYVCQHPRDAQLSVEELRRRDMVGREGEVFSNRVLHYAIYLSAWNQAVLHGSSSAAAMVDTIGLLTIFFTHSAADLQWPELARLICPDDPDSSGIPVDVTMAYTLSYNKVRGEATSPRSLEQRTAAGPGARQRRSRMGGYRTPLELLMTTAPGPGFRRTCSSGDI